MDLLLCLEHILSDFCFLLNQQNFALFQAFIYGFIANRGDGIITGIYQVFHRQDIGLLLSFCRVVNGMWMWSPYT